MNRGTSSRPEPSKEQASVTTDTSPVGEWPAGEMGDEARPQVYTDAKGLPVVYDKVAQEEGKHKKPDAISVLWHELLSPLTLIKGYTSTLIQLSDAITEEQKQQYLRGIDSASNRVVRLLENLRDITHLEESTINVNRSVSLLEMLRYILTETQDQTMKHVIKFHPHAPLPRVKGDPEKLEQVINNLVGNALKYSPDGGDIDVELRMIRTESELAKLYPDAPRIKAPCVLVSIADNGIGLANSDRDAIFEKFYRSSTRLTRAIPGAGLGLYISKYIVEAHGGHIWARNREQGGSIVSFTLPVS